jgi:hypothetical protein
MRALAVDVVRAPQNRPKTEKMPEKWPFYEKIAAEGAGRAVWSQNDAILSLFFTQKIGFWSV